MDSLVTPLIETLKRQAQFVETRPSTSPEDYFEGVLARDTVPGCEALLTSALGAPVKPFGQAPALDRAIKKIVERLGGVRPEQCLFLSQRPDGVVAYAMLWPWASNPLRVTLKVGVSRST